MALDREETLKKAEKLLRQGRLEPAIAEYARVVEAFPRDWNTMNALGDLYVRAGQLERAAEQYGRIADHFTRDGFYSKAAALYKKILKFRPDDEPTQLQLAEISAKQGLMADAKAQLTAVAERRRARGDRSGADEILIRLGSLDAADVDARLNAARVLASSGSTTLAAERFRALAADLFEKNREEEALTALREAVRCNPADAGGRAQLAKAYLARGDTGSAREFLTREIAGSDSGLLWALTEIELREGSPADVEALIKEVLALDPTKVEDVASTALALADSKPETAFLCIDAASEAAIRAGEFARAASLLQEYAHRSSAQVPALLKLVEVCVDGGLESTMYETQAQLCDAYLASGQASEARVIAEDLVAREPWEESNIERFRRALIMLKVPEPDSVIAERLNGQVPFVATDHFPDEGLGPVVPMPPMTEPDPPAPEPVPEPPPATPHEVDLTSALLSLEEDEEDERGAATAAADQPATLDEVFARARESAARHPDAQEAEEQLKVARTCVEAGLFEQAVKAFEQAARSPRHRFEAASALGRLYREHGQPEQAIEWLERAAESPSPSAADGLSLLYELGVMLEENREEARALAVFLELLADAGSYRDVDARVARLSNVETDH